MNTELVTVSVLDQLNYYWKLLGHEGLGYTEIRIDKNKQVFVDNYNSFVDCISQVDLVKNVDVFVGVNPRFRKSGTTKSVSYLTNFVLDIDNPSPDFVLPQELANIGYQVNSGRGIHIYIPIIPLEITDENRNEVVKKCKAVKDYYKLKLKGWAKVDNVHDLARVMRCPGTINTKNNKLAELLTNKPIKIINFDEIDIPLFTNRPIIKDISNSPMFVCDKDIDKIICSNNYPSVSEKVFYLVKKMISLGYSKDQMLSIIDTIKEKDKDYSQDIDRIVLKLYDDLEIKPLSLCLEHYKDNLDKREIGFLTGIKFLDEKTGGFMRKELVVIGARSSIGKTTFCMNIVLEFLEKDLKVLMYPTEMSFTSLIDKLVSMKCKIPLTKFRKNQIGKAELDKFDKIQTDLKNYKFFVSENPAPKLWEIEEDVKRIKPDIMVLDYVQRVSTQMPDKRNMELEMFVRGMKNVAKVNNCCVVVTSQLNRLGDEREPEIKTLRDTDTLEHEGDLVLLLGTENKLEQNRILNFYISKNRYGELGFTALTFDTVYGLIN